jgi:hypothetical protein
MNTKTFCENQSVDIECNSQQHIYIARVRILPKETKCNNQEQCEENVKTFINLIKDKCNSKNICQHVQDLWNVLKRACIIQKPILENVNILCGK